MLKWFNPFVWMAWLASYTKKHFFAWHLSSIVSWFQIGGVSLLYPDWARDIVKYSAPMWEETKILCATTIEVIVDLFHNTS